MSNSMITTPKGREAAVWKVLNGPTLLQSLVKVLPKNLSPERLARQTMTALRRNPELFKCSEFSIVAGMVQAAELGLELSGVLGHCFLIPRYNKTLGVDEATFQMGYKGYREMCFRSGRVASLQPRVVQAGDEFEFCYGSRADVQHKPGKDPGGAAYYYCVAFLIGSMQPDFEVMSVAAVEKWRDRFSSSKKKGAYSPWVTDFDAMALKTVTGRLARRLPLSVEAVNALGYEPQRDEEPLSFSPQTLDILSGAGITPEAGPLQGLDDEPPAAGELIAEVGSPATGG